MQPSLLYHSTLYIIDAVLYNKSISINFADQGHEFPYFEAGDNGEENIIFIQALSSFSITTLPSSLMITLRISLLNSDTMVTPVYSSSPYKRKSIVLEAAK